MKPALVLASHTMGLGVIRALGIMGVPVSVVYYDDRDVGYRSKYVKESIRSPHPEKSETEFIAGLMGLSSHYDGGLVIPTSDAAVASVSRHKAELEQRYVVACTEWETTRLFMDKKLTYQVAIDAGIPVPKTIVPQGVDDVNRYGEVVRFPCLVKPSQSHKYYAVFHKKMVMVDDLGQMMSAYQQATDAGFGVMLQEYIPGPDALGANYNAYHWDGEPLVEFTAQKLRNAPSGLGSPRVAVSKRIPEVVESGRRILRAMGFYGYACTEFKLDPRDGVYKLMEVNGRHNLSSLLAVRCGINFPWIQYKHLMLGATPSSVACETGVYWIDLLRDVVYSVKSGAAEKLGLMEFIRPYISPHVFAILDLEDPKPFIKKLSDIGTMLKPGAGIAP